MIKITMAVLESYSQLSCGAALGFNKYLCQALGIAYREKYRIPIEQEIKKATSSHSFAELMEMAAEMGKIDQFYDMTPAQIEVGYKGYQQHLCNLGNILIVAERRAQDPNARPFEPVSSHSRAETIKKVLGGNENVIDK